MIKKLTQIIDNFFEACEKARRQRNYKLIYSDRYGYGVEESFPPTDLRRQWFLNHSDYIEDA